MISDFTRQRVYRRSGKMCEAMVAVPGTTVWTRCGVSPVEVHHTLKQSRGGDVLDRVGEIYHLMALCHAHHRDAEGTEAYEGNLLIAGHVIWDNVWERPVYTGPDEYLLKTYPNPMLKGLIS